MPRDPNLANPCPICGGRAYTWGSLSQTLGFCPDDASTLRRYLQIGATIRGRRCDTCGNLQLFTRPPAANS